MPAVLTIALVTLAGWLLAGGSAEQALNAALSVLIIACPCALGLATPMALVVASDRGARSGIFFKGYEAVETSGKVDIVLFDKTGTITDGRMSVVDFAAAPGFSERDVIGAAASLERASEHPVGRAIVEQQRGSNSTRSRTSSRSSASGPQGVVAGRVVSIGALRDVTGSALGESAPALRSCCARWLDDARTVVVVCQEGQLIGAIALADTVRPSARRAVAHCSVLGLRCLLVTGDNEQAAQVVAAECGLDGVLCRVSPQDKVDRRRDTAERGPSGGDGGGRSQRRPGPGPG